MKTYHAAHILVKAKYEAEDLLLKLNKGDSFEQLAQKFLNCSSATNGGDLGTIKEGKADPDFEEAALALKVGEVTKLPVRTKFGYHIIKRIK